MAYPQMTLHTVRVLLELRRGSRYGLDLSRILNLKGGSLYPLLDRLEKAGLIDSEWEQIDPHEEGRPPRRYYTINALGRKQVEAALAEAGLVEAS
jgi:PadR family transcriptional regulator PadR